MRLTERSVAIEPFEPDHRTARLSPANDDERLLVAAGTVGRDAAAERLGQDFSGFEFRSLGQSFDTSTPNLLLVSADLLDTLQYRDVIDRQLLAVDASSDAFRLVDGVNEPPIPLEATALRPSTVGGPAGAVRPAGLIEAIQQGATAIVNDISQTSGGRLARLESDLSRVTGGGLQTNIYLSEKEATGFGLHWDDHEVVIVQCLGRKLWEVYEPGALSPVRAVVPPSAGGSVAWSGVLSPGQALYIPRGWPHRVSGLQDEVSLHYTIGISRPSASLLVDALLAATGEGSDGRVDPDRDGFRTPGELAARRTAERMVAEFRGALPSRRTGGPLEVLRALDRGLGNVVFEAPFPGGVVFAEGKGLDPDSIGLLAHGNGLAVAHHQVPIVARLLEGQPFHTRDLVGLGPSSTEADVEQLVMVLAQWDLVRILYTS